MKNNSKILIATDSFKGTLSSIEAAGIIEKGFQYVLPDLTVKKIPLADGGEGTTTTTGISSYDVTDKLLEYIVQAKKRNKNDDDDDDAVEYVFPKVRRIVVMGHSAGGQYVQRWSLLTNSPVHPRFHNQQ